MTNDNKSIFGSIVAAVVALLYFRKKKPAAQPENGGGGGGPFSIPNINVASVPMMDDTGRIVAVVPVVTPVQPTTPVTPPPTPPGPPPILCGTPTLLSAVKDGLGNLVLNWYLNGNAYYGITVQISNDNGATWTNYQGGSVSPRTMGPTSTYAGGKTSFDVKIFGNCSDSSTTAPSNIITVTA